MSDERDENERASDDERTTDAAAMAEALVERVPGLRSCLVLLHTEEGSQAVGAGQLAERIGLIEYARTMTRAEAITRRHEADQHLRAFLDAFDAWCQADSQDGDAAEFDNMLAAREVVRETGWG